jgi:hypothetical protein
MVFFDRRDLSSISKKCRKFEHPLKALLSHFDHCHANCLRAWLEKCLCMDTKYFMYWDQKMKHSSLFSKTLLVFAITTATLAHAQDKGGFMRLEKGTDTSARTQQQQQTLQAPRIITDFGAGINVSVPGLAATNRTSIFDKLLNVSAFSPSWPAFPRIWHEESVLDTIDTTTYWMPKLKALNGGIEFEYKYGRKTTLVMMSSLHKQNAPAGSSVEDVGYQMVRLDPESKRVYPNLRPGYPMVGFCSYELQLTLANGQTLGVEVFNAGTRIKHSKIRTVTHTVFSKFFSIPANMPIQSIMNNYCNDTFVKHVRPYAEANFVPVVVEERFLHSPKNQCHPNPNDSSDGDVDCLKWFAGFDRLRKHISVPRCETLKGGFNVCRLKAKEGNRCPIYRDKNNKLTTAVNQFGLEAYTQTANAFSCDKGLTCKITKQPTMGLLGLVLFKGESFCAK